MSVVFLASNSNGGRRLRAEWPAEALQAAGRTDVSWTSAYLFGPVRPGDVVILHRPIDKNHLANVRAFHRAGAVVIVQEDDDLNCIPPSNRWQIEPAQRRAHDKAIREADGLIVSTQRLLEVYGPLAKRVWLVPNYVPERLASPLYQWSGRPDGRLRVGWAGAVEVHHQDLQWIAPEAERMLAGAMLTSVGDPADGSIERIHRAIGATGDSESFPREDDEAAFYKRMSLADVGIVPLDMGANRRFNESKSWLKALEYMILGVPVVAADLPEQAALVTEGTGFLADNPTDFAEAVQYLLIHATARVAMGRAARERALEFTIERHVDEWTAVLNEFVSVLA